MFVTLVNLIQLLKNNNVTVTLQWPQEAGVVYHVNVLPEISLNIISKSHAIMSHNNINTVNLMIFFYNIQYTLSIISSLCGVTTTKALNHGKY